MLKILTFNLEQSYILNLKSNILGKLNIILLSLCFKDESFI